MEGWDIYVQTFLFALCQDFPVLNKDYSSILSYLYSFNFLFLSLSSILALNVKHFTQNDLDFQIKY